MDLTQDDDDPDSLCDTAKSTAAAKRKRKSEAQPPPKRQHLHTEVELVRCALIKVWAKGTEADPPPIGYVVKVEVRIWGEKNSVLLEVDESRRVFRGQVERGVLTVTKREVDSARENNSAKENSWLSGFVYPDSVNLLTYILTKDGLVCILL